MALLLDATIRLGVLVVVGRLVVVDTAVISGIGVTNLNEQNRTQNMFKIKLQPAEHMAYIVQFFCLERLCSLACSHSELILKL
jgi:hypothetical protein